MEDNRQLREAWDFVEHTGKSIFLTGKAGTGKTTFLKTVVERSTKRTVVVAPTGVAAINAGGMTIHSFFQLPLSPFVPNAKVKNRFDFSKEKRKIIASMDLLIIDEISMVRSDLLDAIDTVLRRFRNRHVPFGGVQLLMIGDLAQLTPVVTSEDAEMLRPYYDTPYFFGAKSLAQTDYVTIQLEKVYRQQDEAFLTLLNHIRSGHPTTDDLRQLNSRHQPLFVPKADEGYIRLTTHNATANNYNESELRKLPSHPYTFNAHIEGTFPEYAYPTTASLVLKEEYRRFLILELFNFNDLYYAEEHLMRVLIDAFYRSHNALTDLHKQTLADLKQQVTDVADKWRAAISRMNIEQLHSTEFIDRIKRSVAYFSEQVNAVMDRPVRLCKEVKSGNKESQKRFDNAFGDLLQAWLFKRSLLERMSEQNFTTAVYLHAKQQSQLDAIDAKLPDKEKKERKKREKAKAPKPEKPKRERLRVGASARMSTLVTTLRLYNEGLNPEQIAEKRGLTISTILNHLMKMAEQGEVDINDIVDPHHIAIIRQAINRIGLEGGMKPIKEACPEDITYDEIRFAIQSFE